MPLLNTIVMEKVNSGRFLFVMITSARARGNHIYSLAQIKNGIQSKRVGSNETTEIIMTGWRISSRPGKIIVDAKVAGMIVANLNQLLWKSHIGASMQLYL
jgi:hypothetical protein